MSYCSDMHQRPAVLVGPTNALLSESAETTNLNSCYYANVCVYHIFVHTIVTSVRYRLIINHLNEKLSFETASLKPDRLKYIEA